MSPLACPKEKLRSLILIVNAGLALSGVSLRHQLASLQETAARWVSSK
jgi:hypothetical protein